MDKKVLTLAGVIAAVSVGTYAVLTLVKPHKHEEVKVADVYSADQIFGGKLDPNAADEIPSSGAAVESAAAPATETAPSEPAATETAAPVAETMATPMETGAVPPPEAPAPAHEQVAAAEPALAEPVAAPAPAAQPEPAPAAVAEPAPAPEATPAPAKRVVAKKKPKPASTASAPAAKAWWPAENPNQLSLVYAGSASFKKAIVLMFNGAFFKPDSPNASLKVTDSKGAAIAGSWELGENNRRMLVFPVPGPGSYKVSVAADLTDAKDRKLGSALNGTVVVQ